MNILIIYMVTIPDCSMEWPLYREQVPSRALIPYVCVCVYVCVCISPGRSRVEDRWSGRYLDWSRGRKIHITWIV